MLCWLLVWGWIFVGDAKLVCSGLLRRNNGAHDLDLLGAVFSGLLVLGRLDDGDAKSMRRRLLRFDNRPHVIDVHGGLRGRLLRHRDDCAHGLVVRGPLRCWGLRGVGWRDVKHLHRCLLCRSLRSRVDSAHHLIMRWSMLSGVLVWCWLLVAVAKLLRCGKVRRDDGPLRLILYGCLRGGVLWLHGVCADELNVYGSLRGGLLRGVNWRDVEHLHRRLLGG